MYANPFGDLASSAVPDPVAVDPMAASDPGDASAPEPPVPTDMAPPTTPDEAESLEQTLYGEDQALADTPPEPDAQSRPWKVNLHASAGSYYDNNIFISPTGSSRISSASSPSAAV